MGGSDTPLDDGTANSGTGAISPDGRWLAYWSDQTGRPEVYIQPFPSGGARTPVSINGGDAPKWSADGRELYYLSGRTMMSVEVDTEPSLRVGRPVELFDATPYRRNNPGASAQYDVAPDGRFLMIRTATLRAETADNLIVITNWTQELTEAVPRD